MTACTSGEFSGNRWPIKRTRSWQMPTNALPDFSPSSFVQSLTFLLDCSMRCFIDLLKHQELRFLVVAIAVGAEIRRFQQAHVIIEMKRAHTDARHRGHFFDCVSHR